MPGFVKNFYPQSKIIVGGHHASLSPSDYLEIDAIDYVCQGEGEAVLVELATNLDNHTRLESIAGLCTKDNNGAFQCNSPRALIHDLDSLPFMDRTVTPNEYRHFGHLPMFAGRGCPYNCTYCANDSIKNLYTNKLTK